VSVRWQVKGIPLERFNDEGGSVGEPFGIMQPKDGNGVIILTKREIFYEGDESKSSHAQ
jgi:hypothetical protein